MLKKLSCRHMIINPFSKRSFVEKIKIKKDYYKILGLPNTATEEEIKIAYRNLAKIYHPDVNIGVEKHQPSIDKFRDIAEAYAVLSNKSMRLDYDLRMRQFPDIIYNSEKMKNMKENEPNRDKTGNQIKPAPMKGSYAEYRLEKLKEWRKQFNVDDFGFYKGGVPRQNQRYVRGDSQGQIGQIHSAWSHNEIHDTPHARPHVSLKESWEHKQFMNTKRTEYKRFRPFFMLDEVDKDSQYYIDNQHRMLFWLQIILISSFAFYWVNKRISIYRNFNHLDKRVQEMKPYEFMRIGPLLVEAPERKFMAKFLGREDYLDWIDNDLRQFG